MSAEEDSNKERTREQLREMEVDYIDIKQEPISPISSTFKFRVPITPSPKTPGIYRVEGELLISPEKKYLGGVEGQMSVNIYQSPRKHPGAENSPMLMCPSPLRGQYKYPGSPPSLLINNFQLKSVHSESSGYMEMGMGKYESPRIFNGKYIDVGNKGSLGCPRGMSYLGGEGQGGDEGGHENPPLRENDSPHTYSAHGTPHHTHSAFAKVEEVGDKIGRGVHNIDNIDNIEENPSEGSGDIGDMSMRPGLTLLNLSAMAQSPWRRAYKRRESGESGVTGVSGVTRVPPIPPPPPPRYNRRCISESKLAQTPTSNTRSVKELIELGGNMLGESNTPYYHAIFPTKHSGMMHLKRQFTGGDNHNLNHNLNYNHNHKDNNNNKLCKTLWGLEGESKCKCTCKSNTSNTSNTLYNHTKYVSEGKISRNSSIGIGIPSSGEISSGNEGDIKCHEDINHELLGDNGKGIGNNKGNTGNNTNKDTYIMNEKVTDDKQARSDKYKEKEGDIFKLIKLPEKRDITETEKYLGEIGRESPAASQEVQSNPHLDSIPYGYICDYCRKSFQTGQALGGHMSRSHPGISEKYKMKKNIRDKRILDRERLYLAKQLYFEDINHMKYDKMKKSKTGRKKISELLSRAKLKRYKKMVTYEMASDSLSKRDINDYM